MIKNDGVRVDAPSDDPGSWRVRVPVRGGAGQLQFEISSHGAWCTDKFDAKGRRKPNLYVPSAEFLRARQRASDEFGELRRLAAKNFGDAKKTA